MNRQGFSIVELITVILIVSLLLAVAALNYSRWQTKSNVEKEVKELYADMMDMRQQALVRAMTHRVDFTSMNSIRLVRFANENDAVGTQLQQRNLPYAITQSATPFPSIDFNSRGMMVDPATKSICVFSDSGAAVDSIVIMQSRISLGRLRNQGGACDAANIDIQ